MSLAEEYMLNILQICETARMKFLDLSSKLRTMDEATQDILHMIEFENLDPIIELAAIKKLKEIRKERRLIKNEIEQLQSLLDSSHGRLVRTNEKIIRLSEEQKCRVYIPRVLINGKDDLLKAS